jgi:phosphoserine phosphatase
MGDSRVLLIEVSGPDRAGVTHSLTRILGCGGARVLDIGQAVIHSSLALGILVEFTPEMGASTTLTDLLLKAHDLGMQIRFTVVSRDEYAGWVSGQTKQRFIVTVLGPSITAQHLAAISGTLAEHGLNIDRIDRLSGRTTLDSANGSGRVCVELSTSGSLNDEDAIREELLDLTARFDIDIAFQHDNVYRRNRRLVAFDMDSTLIQAEVIDELALEVGAGEQVRAITEAAMRGEIDFQESFRKRVSLLRGLSESTLERIAERIPLMDGAERLVVTLRKLGYKTAILSGGFTFFGKRLQQRLGIDYLHANDLEIRDGVVTGNVVPPVVDGPRKAALLARIATSEGLSMEQVIAVGDGANDLPMLRLAGLGIAFRAKAVVRQNARQALSTLGPDGILYLLGVRDRESAI